MKRLLSLAAVAIMIATSVTTSADAAPRQPPCPTDFASTPRMLVEGTTDPIVNVRARQRRCFDRLVIKVDGDINGYFVRYVRRIRQDGSGIPVPVEGEARLQVVAIAPSYDEDGQPTISGARIDNIDVSDFRTFRDVANAGSFEGQTTIGLGVAARLPFRVQLVDGPGEQSRLIIDVLHEPVPVAE